VHSSKLTAAVVLGLLLTVAVCSGSGGSPTSAPAATQPAAQPTAAGGEATTAPAGGPTTAPGGGTSDPCAVLSLADIKAATGIDYPAGTVDSGDCLWELTVGTYSNVTVGFDSTSGFSAVKAAFPGGTDLTVSGHPAYQGVTGSMLQSLWVDLGSTVLTVIIAPSPANATDVVKKLAEAAIAKL